MEELVVGIDLCDSYTQINCAEEEKTWSFPTVICRHKTEDAWFVGEEAYAHTLKGDGIIVDKLVKLVCKDGTATLGNVRYEARELLALFLERIMRLPEEEYGKKQIGQLVFTVKKMNQRLSEALYECGEKLGISRERIHIISHSESYIYYILSQRKEIWNGTVGMFDLSAEGLRYYEMKVQRGLKNTTVIAEQERLDESFNLDILKNDSGAKLADRILCSCASRLMQNKNYSSAFLMGKGFEDRSWADEFMKLLCTKRRVYMELAVFSKGAACRAFDLTRPKTAFPYTMICDGRLKSTVSMNVIYRGQETSVVLAAAGDNWYEQESVVDVIPEHQDTVDLVVTPLDTKRRREVSIRLEGFPERPERTTKVRVKISFLDERTMDVRILDQGFGEIYPSSDIQIRQEVML